MADLAIEFCGLKMLNPFWLASSPVSDSREMMARAFEAGWGGAVLKTLTPDTEELNLVSPKIWGIDYQNQRLMGMVNIDLNSERTFEICLEDIKYLKYKYPRHLVIASLMAGDEDSWKDCAKQIENTGADLIEVSLSCPHGMPERGMGAIVGQDPELVLKISSWVKEAVSIPVIVKLTPNVADITPMAQAVKASGCDGITLIDTVKALLGIDLDSWAPLPSVGGKSTFGGYSGPAIKPIALRFVATAAKAAGLPVSGVGGMTSWQDAAEFFLCGSRSVQLCTAPMHYGYRMIEDLCEGLNNYLDQKGLGSLDELIGRALPNLVTYKELNKAQSVVAKIDKKTCRRDELCYLACRDGGHQAITPDKERFPVVDENKCLGCGLCRSVCPVDNCITYVNSEKHHKIKREGVRW